MTQKLTDKYWVGAALMAAVGFLLKLVFLAIDAFPFNSDEAIVALMARHILGRQWPAFFYGQAYMGSLDATLVAAGFAILGESVWVIRLIQSILYFATVMTGSALAWSIYRKKSIAWIVAALLAIPTVNVLLYSTVSLGGYGEALLIGNLLMLLALRVWRGESGYVLWGFLAGLGFLGVRNHARVLRSFRCHVGSASLALQAEIAADWSRARTGGASVDCSWIPSRLRIIPV